MIDFPDLQPGQRFGRRGEDGTLVLDQDAADLLNKILAGLKRSANFAAAAPLAVSSDSSGRSVSLGQPPSIWARLYGTSNPYTFHEVTFVPGTGWQLMPTGNRGNNAYAANGVASLDGKIVRLTFEPTANDWRFQWQKCCWHKTCFITETTCIPSAFQIDGITGVFTKTDGQGDTYTSDPSTGRVTSYSSTSIGSGYDPTNPPTILFSGGGGTGASGVPNFGGGAIQSSIPVTNGGSGYRLPVVSFSGGAFGSGASALATGAVSGFSILGTGSGYTNGTGYSLSFVGGSGSGAAGTFDVVGGAITNLVITNGGSNYRSSPSVSFSAAGGGTGAFAIPTLTITAITLLTGGSVYMSPTVTIADNLGFGSGATATATASTIGCGVTITDGGSGYTSAPSVSISGGSGSGAAGTAFINKVLCITVPDGTYDGEFSASGWVTLDITGQTMPAGPAAGPIFLFPTGAHTYHNCTVLDANTGLPISGATVTLQNANASASCTTDIHGKCDLTLGFDEDSGYILTATISATGYHTLTNSGFMGSGIPCANLPCGGNSLVPI